MKFQPLSIFTLCLLGSGMCVQAQERAAGGTLETQMTWSALKNNVESVQTYAEGVNSLLQQMLTCSKKGMLYVQGTGNTPGGCRTVGDTTPTGTVGMFALTTCPTGWVEYTPARGRFVRGIDSTGSIDPSGRRAPGNLQAATLAAHSHNLFANDVNPETGDLTSMGTVAKTGTKSGSTYQSYVLRPGSSGATVGRSSSVGGDETRPANVALLYCRKT